MTPTTPARGRCLPLVPVLLALAALGCSKDLGIGDRAWYCTADRECASGYGCLANRCRALGTVVDAGDLPDLPDVPDAAPDGLDAADAPGADVEDALDVVPADAPDVAYPDAPDVSPDAADPGPADAADAADAGDVFADAPDRSDAPLDAASDRPDPGADLPVDAPDAAVPDVPDAGADLRTDAPADLPVDAAPDLPADVATDASPDASLDAPDACVPSCDGRQCGDDGCGGSCGSCPGACSCGVDGRCARLEVAEGGLLDCATGLRWYPTALQDVTYAAASDGCAGLPDDGLGPWHLPTLDELRTLVRGCPDTGTGGACGLGDACSAAACSGPACLGCDPGFGPSSSGCYEDDLIDGDPCGRFWSATVPDGTHALTVDFDDGSIGTWATAGSNRARCVRGP